ncbi:thiopurine S-methyltransferase [Alteromonas sp. 1_MG-2023]|uniref:thiopurine S-methyltransferase n=1 Tax=Alteromonas sp. 1_MG-2023 TaxID=3062669 RepID=UPI0026E1DCA4|nr:thiopurine S-methyltransferase [Alteromonas sp. 1_MG-2023]MDO6475762.1 thiopurine S-methyltransferase [Alteromonas sp. 1_MG-2023]MEC7691454.1 thiopurine S-methyltransferase [Pseudomonadota bacterium]
MDPQFWMLKWQNNETGFHEPEANPNLTANIDQLSLAPGSRIFVPLCGKTLDIPWLLSKGYEVVAAELSHLAIIQLFDQLNIIPDSEKLNGVTRYDVPNFTLFGGDIFDLTADMLGKVDAIYDRAALVALPFEMRVRYAAHLREITNTAPQLLVTFDYDQQKLDGPPFSVISNEVEQHYIDHYSLTLLQGKEINLKGKVPAQENVWLLK